MQSTGPLASVDAFSFKMSWFLIVGADPPADETVFAAERRVFDTRSEFQQVASAEHWVIAFFDKVFEEAGQALIAAISGFGIDLQAE